MILPFSYPSHFCTLLALAEKGKMILIKGITSGFFSPSPFPSFVSQHSQYLHSKDFRCSQAECNGMEQGVPEDQAAATGIRGRLVLIPRISPLICTYFTNPAYSSGWLFCPPLPCSTSVDSSGLAQLLHQQKHEQDLAWGCFLTNKRTRKRNIFEVMQTQAVLPSNVFLRLDVIQMALCQPYMRLVYLCIIFSF